MRRDLLDRVFGLTVVRRSELDRILDALDVNHDGCISLSELAHVLRAFKDNRDSADSATMTKPKRR